MPTISFPFFNVLSRACIAAALGFGAFQANAQTQAPTQESCVEVKLINVLEGIGNVKLVVWGSAETFFKKPVAFRRIKAEGSVMRVPLCGLEAKEIAITVYQDVNENDKMDTNPLGIPTEPYGASGTQSTFGAPTWDTTKLTWIADQTIEIRF